METIRVDILNSKAKILLENLADLDLIRIRKEKSDFMELVERLRENTKDIPSLEEITIEVEAVRKKRYE